MCGLPTLFVPISPSLNRLRPHPLAVPALSRLSPTVPRLSPPRRRRTLRIPARAASTPPPSPGPNPDPEPAAELEFEEDPRPAPTNREEFLAYLDTFPKDPSASDDPTVDTDTFEDAFDAAVDTDADASAADVAARRGRAPLPTNNGLLASLFTYVRFEFSNDIDVYLSSPLRVVLASAVALLFGVFSATSASTIIGSVADWDPLAAAVLLVWTESFTKFYYKQTSRSRVLQLINAFKIGLIYGMAVDAFKLST